MRLALSYEWEKVGDDGSRGVGMRTLFLGSYGFGNLGDELCLIDAVRQYKPTEAWAFSAAPDYTKRTSGVANFIRTRAEIAEVKPERIVLGGGGVGFWPSLKDSLHWMKDGLDASAELHVYNIGVGKIENSEWFSDETVRAVFKNLASFTVRDHVSRWLVKEWDFDLNPGITYYPEYTLTPQPFQLPVMPGPLIGFSITGQQVMLDSLERNRDKIRQFIIQLGNFSAVPIVSTVQDNADEDDIRGFNAFAEMFLQGKQIVFREMLDRNWWSSELTPLRLKYVISKLNLLVSQRKHNVIHAIGTGTPFVGIFPDADDSILRIMFSLRHRIPTGSSFLSLDSGKYGAP